MTATRPAAARARRAPGVEREAALLIVSGDPQETARRIASLRRLGPYQLVPRGLEQFVDTYFDTSSGALGARRIALRVRRFPAEGRALTTLKTPGQRSGLHSSRGELEVPLTEAGARKVLGKIEHLGLGAGLPSAREFAAGEWESRADQPHLRPVQVRGNRRLLRDARSGATRVAELAIDRVRYRIGSGEVLLEEVEVEAKDSGGAADVEALTHALLDRFAGELRPWAISKLAVGMILESWKRQGVLEARLTRRRTLDAKGLRKLELAGAKG